MFASQIIKYCLLSTLLLLAGCALLDDGATKRPANSGLIATPVGYYSTSRARYLGAKYKDNLDRLVERIVRNPKTATLQFANNISSVGGIGFYTHSVTKSADERFLEVVLAAPETFESKGGHSDKVNRLFGTYGSELLTILSGDNDIYQDKELSGYGINLAWRNVVAEAAGSRVILERAIIYLTKDKTRRFLRREISQSDLLADATIFAVEEDGPLNLISYRAPEVRQESAPAVREDDIPLAPVDAVPAQSPVMPADQDKKIVPLIREPVAKAAPPKPPVTVAQKTKPLPLKPAPEPVAKPAAPKPAAPVDVAKLAAPAPRIEPVAPAISQAKPIDSPAPVVDALPAPELKPFLPVAPPQVEAAVPAPRALKPILPALPPPPVPAVAKSAPPVLAEVAVKPVPAVMTAPVAKVETRAIEPASAAPVVVPPAPLQPMLPAAPPVVANSKPALIEAPVRPVVPTPSPPAVTKPVEITSVPAAVTKPAPVQPTVEPLASAPAVTSAAKPAAEQLALLTPKPPAAAPIKPAIARPVTPRALEGFIIQLAFNDKDRAQRWAEGMAKKGFAVSVTEAGNEGALRVRLGNFTARDDAERQLRALKQDGLNGIILNLPQGFRPEARSSIP